MFDLALMFHKETPSVYSRQWRRIVQISEIGRRVINTLYLMLCVLSRYLCRDGRPVGTENTESIQMVVGTAKISLIYQGINTLIRITE